MGVGGWWVGGTGLWHRVDECTNELSDVTSTMSMWLTRVMYSGVPAAEEVHGRRGVCWLGGDFDRLHTWPERLGYVTGPCGHPHEPLARWLVPRVGIPSHNYCTVLL